MEGTLSEHSSPLTLFPVGTKYAFAMDMKSIPDAEFYPQSTPSDIIQQVADKLFEDDVSFHLRRPLLVFCHLTYLDKGVALRHLGSL